MATHGIERISIPGGSLLLNRGFAGADAVLAFVRAGGFLDPARAPEPLATAQPSTRATKLAVPGVGACVLKEMFVPPEAGFRRRFRIWFRMAVRRKFRRTFLVSAAARAAGIPVYEPYAYWTDRRGGLRMFFLCEFVEGPSFEDLCRGMRYRAEDVVSDIGWTDRHPIKQAYLACRRDDKQRMWDPLVVVQAVEGDAAFALSERGTVEITAGARTLFTPAPGGNVRYQLPGDPAWNDAMLARIRAFTRMR